MRIGRGLRRSCFAALATGLLLPVLALGADKDLPYGTFEVAPFAGYQLGGSFKDLDTGQHYSLDDHASFALALDAPADHSSQYELFYDRQSTRLTSSGAAPIDVKVEYLHIGGTIPLDDNPRARPYLAGGLGVTRFTPESSAGHDDTVFSLSLALGLRAPLTRNLSFRAEARGLLSFMNTDSAVFCSSGQSGANCRIAASGSGQLQLALLAGLAYRF
jgi:opacity protein-like surface antigen